MKDYSEQHKKAWEYDAYDFWVRHEGTPEERAREDVAGPRKMLRKYAQYFRSGQWCKDCQYLRFLRKESDSFNEMSIDKYVGNFDTTDEETALIRTKLQETTMDDYDRLIQLCDAISGAEGVMDIIERMSDVRRRYGAYDPEKWNKNLELKLYFEDKMKRDLYKAVEKDYFIP